MSGHGPVAVQPHGLVTCGTIVWSHRGSATLTVIAKTSHSLRAPHALIAPEPLDGFERHHQGDPTRTVRAPSDAVARLPRAEVLHAGRVIAPAGVTMTRLALSRGDRVLVDKRRLAKATDDSPGLGPLARASAERVALLGKAQPPTFDPTGVYVIPEAFDFAFEQAAPADQQCDELLQGDRVLLANLHPTLPELIVTLPLVPPTARALAGTNVAPLSFACRRVLVDTDDDRIVLTWLASLPLHGLAAARSLRVEVAAPSAAPPPVAAAALDARGLVQRAVSGAAAAKVAARAPAAATGTMILDDTPAPPGTGTMIVGDDAPAKAPAMPFAAAVRPPTAPRGGASAAATPWAKGDAARPKPAPAAAAALGLGTMAIDVDPPSPPARLPVPPAPPPPAPSPPSAPPPPRKTRRPPAAGESTAPAPRKSRRPPAAGESTPPPRKTRRPPAEPPPPPKEAPPAGPPPAPAPRSPEDVWAKRPEAPMVAPPPKPKPEPRANALNMLYRKGK